MRFLLLGLCSFLTVCASSQYNLTIEQPAPAAATGTVYRFYVEANDPSDRLVEVFGNAEAPLVISTPDGIFNSAFNGSWNASGIDPALIVLFRICRTTALPVAMTRMFRQLVRLLPLPTSPTISEWRHALATQ